MYTALALRYPLHLRKVSTLVVGQKYLKVPRVSKYTAVEAEEDYRVSVTSQHGQALHYIALPLTPVCLSILSVPEQDMFKNADRQLPFGVKPYVRLYRDTGQFRGQPISHGRSV